MIDVAVIVEDNWPAHDWQALVAGGCAAALAESPQAAFATIAASVEVSIRLTSDSEVRSLNRQYRKQDKATNVLSFPMVERRRLGALADHCAGEALLGDIVLAHGVCAAEAAEKGVSLADHATHLIVHGMLHLLGHDHQGTAEAEAMEAIERAALASLGIADPYQIDD